MNKLIDWFEIPASDMARARAFYETVFSVELREEQVGPIRLAVFPYNTDEATGGALASCEFHRPSESGVVIYFKIDDLDVILSRVVPAGGKIDLPRTPLPPPMGFFAHFTDTEGNRVGLHGLK